MATEAAGFGRTSALFLSSKSDLAATRGLLGWSHELTDGVDQLSDRIVVNADFGFQFGQLPREFFVASDEFPKLEERPDDEHADFHSSGRVEYRCRHDRAVFRERVGEVFSVPTAAGL